eukprot:gene15919-18923_t
MLLKKFKMNVTRVRESKREVERLVVALSGGVSSRVMLDLIDNCIGENAKRSKMFFDIRIVHIDRSAVGSPSVVAELQTVCDTYRLPLTVVPIEDVYMGRGDRTERAQILRDTFASSLSSNSSREDLLEHFTMQLLYEATVKLGCTKMLLGTSSNRLAIKLLSSTSKGRGYSVPNETNIVDQQRKSPINQLTLCYSCRKLTKEMKETSNLPAYVKENSKTITKSYQLRNEIKDFFNK